MSDDLLALPDALDPLDIEPPPSPRLPRWLPWPPPMEDLGIVPVPTPPLLVVELLEPVILIQLIVLERPHQREWAPRLSLKKGRFFVTFLLTTLL